MPKQPSKKELIEQVERLRQEIESKNDEISELNKQNFEYKELLNEYKEEAENFKKSAPSPARAKEINNHLQQWGAERIQACYRGRLARREMQNRVAQLADYDENDFGSKYSIDMEEYEYLLKGNSKEEEEEEMGRAALKIQAVHRGRKSRAEVQEIKEQTQAVNKIAAIQRGRKSRAQVQEIKEQTKAAVKIQAIHRGRRSRSVSRTRNVDNDINNYDNNNYNDDEDLSSLSSDEEDNDDDDVDEEVNSEAPKRVKSIPYKILSSEEVEKHKHVITHHVGKIVKHNGEVSSSDVEDLSSSDEEN